MKTKEVAVLLQNEQQMRTTSHIASNLEMVFGDWVHVSPVCADEATGRVTANCDLCLQMVESEISNLRGIVTDLSDVLTVSRAIRRDALPLLEEIPIGSDILVVNETYELALKTANSLFEIGFGNISWQPFNAELEDWDRYRHIQTAITPNEVHAVPPFIKHVINIGERLIDTHSMVRIAAKLGLDNETINSRLLRYSKLIVEPKSSMAKQYLDNYQKSEILKHHTHNQPEGILLCDPAYRLLYANERANIIFEQDLQQPDIELKDLFVGQSSQILKEDFVSDLILIGDDNYAARKTEIINSGVRLGFSITLQDEKSIRDSESMLAQQLAKRGLRARTVFSDIISVDPKMKECIELAKQASATDFTVLIEGESGTGKELLAQAIHNRSSRNAMPFIAINCAAMPESLLESELFGYEGGAFTGARRQGKPGLFEQANGGTLFLDEIGDMPASLQALLLRALQEKQIMRLGSDRIINIDVRIIAATNKRLSEEAEQKRFRPDLYYRLNVLPLRIPPLRQRPKDTPLLLKNFLGADYEALTAEQMQYLLDQPWPGNVRQLQNFCYYFKTTHKTEGFFHEIIPRDSIDVPDLLSLIDLHSTPSHGVGRAALQEIYRKNNCQISDAWLRKELARIQAEGYIEIGKGRLGCRITAQGRELLAGKTEAGA